MKAASFTEALTVGQECFTSLKCCLSLGPFNGNAREMCELLDQVLMDLCGGSRVAVIDRESAQDLTRS